jgi:hypothetical protein
VSFTDKSRDIRTSHESPWTGRGLEGLARRLPGASDPRHVVMVVVGLAAVAHLAQDRRNLQHVVMVVVVLAAIEGLARGSKDRLLARLVAWDRRRNLSEPRTVRIRQA